MVLFTDYFTGPAAAPNSFASPADFEAHQKRAARKLNIGFGFILPNQITIDDRKTLNQNLL